MENDKTNIQALMFPENDVSQKHCIVDDYKLGEYAKAYIYDWAEVILDLYDSGKERHRKQIVDQLYAENFELNEIREALKDVSATLDSWVEQTMKV